MQCPVRNLRSTSAEQFSGSDRADRAREHPDAHTSQSPDEYDMLAWTGEKHPDLIAQEAGQEFTRAYYDDENEPPYVLEDPFPRTSR